MIQLKVTWTNANSNLISNARADDLIVVAQNDAAAAEDKGRRTNDARFFTVKDDGLVKVTFDLKVDVPGITPSLNTILKVVQRFECKGGVLSVRSYDTVIGPVADIPGTHPLVSMPAAQQATGAAVMVITTDFVDVTIPWFTDVLRPGSDGRNVWDHGPHFDANFRVLACLNGTPKLWFASIPNSCVKADAVSALVFFRPAGYPYSLAGDDDFSCVFNPDHNDKQGTNFFKIWRFLMEPVCNRSSAAPTPAAGTPPRTSFHGRLFFDHMDENDNPPAAMERSLNQAGKPVVVLFPVVDGSKYGTSTSAQLAEMTRLAVACLHSMGMLIRDDSKKTPFRGLKRLGVAGFSFGGTALWTALNSAVVEHQRKGGSPNRIQEIYVFDANGWRAQQANPVDILMTAKQTGDARLRVVVAKGRDANLDSFKASTKLTSSAHPDFKAKPDLFNLAKTKEAGGNPDINGWYLHYTKALFDSLGEKKWFVNQGKGKGIPDEGNLDRGARHQFVVFGGEDPKVGETFFCRFLKESGF
jgi:hypothetical protein